MLAWTRVPQCLHTCQKPPHNTPPPFSFLATSLTANSTVLLQKPTRPQPVKKFPTFHRTRKFITVYTTARHSFPSPNHITPTQALPLRPYQSVGLCCRLCISSLGLCSLSCICISPVWLCLQYLSVQYGCACNICLYQSSRAVPVISVCISPGELCL